MFVALGRDFGALPFPDITCVSKIQELFDQLNQLNVDPFCFFQYVAPNILLTELESQRLVGRLACLARLHGQELVRALQIVATSREG